MSRRSLSTFRRISTADTNAVVVKAAPADLYAYAALNINAAVRYLKLYDKATTPSEVDTPLIVLPLAASAGSNQPLSLGAPVAFRTGLAIRIVVGLADNSTTPPAAGDQLVNLFYL